MNDADYPALFRSADAASNRHQKRYIALIVCEYVLLFLASILTLGGMWQKEIHAIAALVLIASVAILLTRSYSRPEQDWYRSRALAESVKTLSWRYAMKAHPFDQRNKSDARNEFRENLDRLFRNNSDIANRIDPNWSAEHQITEIMDELSKLPLSLRKQYYDEKRISEQRSWYRTKAIWNARMSRIWVLISVACYASAISLSIGRISIEGFYFWPIEPLIVVASSIVGWIQIKKYNELSAAYTVTSHEIGLIHITLRNSQDVKTFSRFINEAETAFSREHTLWIARQAY